MNPELAQSEFTYRTARSSGKGGQHVNKVETKVEALFSVQQSEALTAHEKHLLIGRYTDRLNADGQLTAVDQSSRSQITNRQRAAQKLLHLLEKGLEVSKPRKKTLVPFSVMAARLENKRKRAETKANRRRWD